MLCTWIQTHEYEVATAKPAAGSRNLCGRSIKDPVRGRHATISVSVYRTHAAMMPATR